MTIDRVSDIFAFVAKNAEFSKSILFAETEAPEIQPEERLAIAAVQDHVRDSYVALLSWCRNDIFARAANDNEFQKTMGRNWNRDKSIWERGRVELPLVIESSYVAVVYFWIDEEGTRPGVLSLVSELWVQTKRRQVLMDLATKAGPPLFIVNGNLRMLASELTEGKTFDELAKELASQLWPKIVDLRAALTSGVQ